jgi:hypothetical protein
LQPVAQRRGVQRILQVRARARARDRDRDRVRVRVSRTEAGGAARPTGA